MYQHILLPLDGSAQAEEVLAYGLQLAQAFRARATLLHVSEPAPASRGHAGARPLGPRERALGGAHGTMAGHGVNAATAVVAGWPVDAAIVRYARGHGCDIIAMTKYGRTAPAAWFLGGVADKVLHAATVPVLLVTPATDGRGQTPERPIQRLVVPLDGSPVAETALPHVRALASKLGVDVALVHVVPSSTFELLARQGRANDPRLDEYVMGSATQYLARTAGRLRQQGLRTTEKVLVGDPAAQILDYAKGAGASLIVICNRGHSGFGQWALGSVAERIVRYGRGAVLVTPAGPEQAPGAASPARAE